ncbi:MAG: CBS domain-containing protein [Bacteriovoracaceae bacterium]|nr:CBS domain-containing protein [Bacteriovoracaceae bacterium]
MNLFTKLLNTPLSELDLSGEILTCRPGSNLQDVLNFIKSSHAGSIVITNEQKQPVGIITERDFLFKITGNGIDFSNSLIDEYMTPHPTTVEVTSTLQQVMQCMNLGGFRNVIIVNKKSELVSVISINDVLSFVYEKLNVDELPEEIEEILPELPIE